ncbi:centrosome-associated protein CEP250-like [Notothenia coriiceps]|uniref:Centrosome-associated protein CEP250-like n=1 Tax=Notothenia coriiceps TaxID=8208 RepID=A0A6I9NQJ2_9TELE|nr:PREDICTED: centrosome-associated protein CEP250-like [Notothenia coriiceps]
MDLKPDEAWAQIGGLSQQITGLCGSQEKSATQLLQLQDTLKQSEQGKREMSECLQETQTALSLQEKVACRTEREKRLLEAEVARFRTGLQAAEAESRALQDKLELFQGLQSGAKVEQQNLKESLQAAEGRLSCLELSQRTREGELQRAQLRAAELEAESGALQERLTELRRKLGESEERGVTLRPQ